MKPQLFSAQTYPDCPQPLADDLWLLGNYYFNLFYIRGREKSALVEMGVTAVVDAVIGQLAVLDAAPDYLVLTHPHTDHISGMPGLMERFPAAEPIYGKGAREFATHPKALAAMVGEDDFISRRLAEEGVTVGRAPLSTLSFPEGGLEVAREMDLDLGGITLRLLPAGGHSPGNIMVHIPEREALIVSDALGFHWPGRRFMPLFFTGCDAFYETLERIAALEPAILGLGHQGPLLGPLAEKAIGQALQAHSDLVQEIRGRSDSEALARELFAAAYVDEFTLYSESNIMNCCRLLVRRAVDTI